MKARLISFAVILILSVPTVIAQNTEKTKTTKVTTEGGDITLDSKVKFQNVVELTDPLLTTYFKGLDAGGNIFAGYETAGGMFFQLNTQLGMLKINPENKWISDDKSSIKNTGFGLSIGYRF